VTPVDVAAVGYIDDFDEVLLIVDQVDDSIRRPACPMQADQRAGQGLANAVRVLSQRTGAELQNCDRRRLG
jgi:hypothetical protein